MKRLILVRHAKSSWSDPNADDKERPLNARGRDVATKLGAWLADQNLLPDQVVASTALRCRQTWEQILPVALPAPNVRFEEYLYLAGSAEMLEVLKSATGETVLMLGHMPGVGDLARDLRQDPPPHHDLFRKYPTGAVTVLDFNVNDWDDITPGAGTLLTYATPDDM